MRRLVPLAVLLSAAIAPVVAAADVGVRDVTPRNARSGDVVRITVRGFLGPRPWRPMPVVLVPESRAPRPYACRGGYCTPSVYVSRLRSAPYRLLGEVRQWRPNDRTGGNAVGVLTARVPRVARGRYVLGLFCSACTRGPKGSLIIDYRLILTIRG